MNDTTAIVHHLLFIHKERIKQSVEAVIKLQPS